MTGTGASMRLTEHGFAVLPAPLDLQPTASGAWTDTGLQVALPAAGTYQLDATVRAALAATSPCNVYISARLFDVTAGAVVPDSEVIIHQINLSASAGVVNGGLNVSGPIQIEYVTAGPRTVRVQAKRVNATGVSITAQILYNADGRTTLRFTRIA
ncbi:hypothetical protein ABT255_03505 [Streptomyces mirabilis]|uniref:hypothetical protein n=1 Tax=Streptomyces mirabilis TaxID=68239 RepID=UPI00332069B1